MLKYKGKKVVITKIYYAEDVEVSYKKKLLPIPIQYKIEAVDGSWDDYVCPNDLDK